MKEQVREIKITDLYPFKNHPFYVKDDESMQSLCDSIREYGILSPLLARPAGEGYELVSGHRRRAAALKLGLETLPVLVRDLIDDEAIILMVDSNIQRENLLPSEKAFAYKMKLEAIKHTKFGITSSKQCLWLSTRFKRPGLLSTQSGPFAYYSLVGQRPKPYEPAAPGYGSATLRFVFSGVSEDKSKD